MKRFTFLSATALVTYFLAAAASPQPSSSDSQGFPGLRAILSPVEFQQAGLDRLSAQELSRTDAAIRRHYAMVVAADRPDRRERYETRFGLPEFVLEEWRDMPPLRSRVTEMTGGNSFRLANGQVWKGVEPIPYQLPNQDVEISARPGGHFDLFVGGNNTTVRVRRIR